MSTIDTTFQPGNRTPVRDASTQGDYAQQQFQQGWRLHLDTQLERATWRSPWSPNRLRLPWRRAKRIAHQHASEWGHRILRDGSALAETPVVDRSSAAPPPAPEPQQTKTDDPRADSRVASPPEHITKADLLDRFPVTPRQIEYARKLHRITILERPGRRPRWVYVLDADFYAWLDGCRARSGEAQTTRDGLEILPTREVLMRFPVSEKQLVLVRSTGKITAQKAGRRWRYVVDERFRAWVRACHRRKTEATIERTWQAMQQAEREGATMVAQPPRLIPGDGMPDPGTLDLFARPVDSGVGQ